MHKASPETDYRKILVVRFSSLGDIVLTTSVLMALRRRYPDAQIDYLLKEQYRPLLVEHPSNCGIISLTEELRTDSKAYIDFCDELQSRNYDLIVDLQGNGRSYVLRKRIFRDYVVVKKRTLNRILLVKFGHGKDRYPDVRKRFLKTTEILGIDYINEPSRAIIGIIESEISNVRDKFLPKLENLDRLIAIHPGSRWPLKEWGGEKYRCLAKSLIDSGYQIIVLGERLDIE